MNYEDIYLIINLEKYDLADALVEQMFREEENDEDEEYPDIPDDELVSKLLIDEGLSIERLEDSYATIQNIDKKLYIRFDINNELYSLTLLEYIQPLQNYLNFATSFNMPKKVLIVDVSTQIGGIIDTNYGIKFKINFTDIIDEGIRKERISSSNSKDKINNENIQATLYIKALCGVSNNDDSYDDSIYEIIEKLSGFYIEGLNQINQICHDKSSLTYKILHRNRTLFYFGSFKDKYYGIVFFRR